MTANTNQKINSNRPSFGDSVRDTLLHVVGQIRIWKKAYPGIMHFLIFWGVTIQVIGTAINIQQMALFTPWALTWPREEFYLVYEFLMDLGKIPSLEQIEEIHIRAIETSREFKVNIRLAQR